MIKLITLFSAQKRTKIEVSDFCRNLDDYFYSMITEEVTITTTTTTSKRKEITISIVENEETTVTKKRKIISFDKRTEIIKQLLRTKELQWRVLFKVGQKELDDLVKITGRFFVLCSWLQTSFSATFFKHFYSFLPKMEKPTMQRAKGDYRIFSYLRKHKYRSIKSFYERSNEDSTGCVDIFYYYRTEANENKLDHFIIPSNYFALILVDSMLDMDDTIRKPFQLPSSLYQAILACEIDLKDSHPLFGTDSLTGIKMDPNESHESIPSYVHRNICIPRLMDFNAKDNQPGCDSLSTSFTDARTSIDSVDILQTDIALIYKNMIFLSAQDNARIYDKTAFTTSSHHCYSLSLMCGIWSEKIFDICEKELTHVPLWPKCKYYISLREFLLNRLVYRELAPEILLLFYGITLFFTLLHEHDSDEDEVIVKYVYKMRPYMHLYMEKIAYTNFIQQLAAQAMVMLRVFRKSHEMMMTLYQKPTYKSLRAGRLIPLIVNNNKKEIIDFIKNNICHIESEAMSNVFDISQIERDDMIALVMNRAAVSPIDLRHSLEIIVSKFRDRSERYTILLHQKLVICVLSTGFFDELTKIWTPYFLNMKGDVITRTTPLPLFPQMLRNFYCEGRLGVHTTMKMMLSMFYNIKYRIKGDVASELMPKPDDDIVDAYLLLPDILKHFDHDYEIWNHLQAPYMFLNSMTRFDKDDIGSTIMFRYMGNRRGAKWRAKDIAAVNGEEIYIENIKADSIYSGLKSFVFMRTPHTITEHVLVKLVKTFQDSTVLRERFPLLSSILDQRFKNLVWYRQQPNEVDPNIGPQIYLPNKVEGYQFPSHVLFYELIGCDALPPFQALSIFFNLHLERAPRKGERHIGRGKTLNNLDIRSFSETQVKQLNTVKDDVRKHCYLYQSALDRRENGPDFEARSKDTNAPAENFRSLLQSLEILSYYRGSVMKERELKILQCEVTPTPQENINCENGIQVDMYRGLVDRKVLSSFIPLTASEILADPTVSLRIPIDYYGDVPLAVGQCLPIWKSNIVDLNITHRYIMNQYYESKKRAKPSAKKKAVNEIYAFPELEEEIERLKAKKKKVEETIVEEEDGEGEPIDEPLADTPLDYWKTQDMPLFGMNQDIIELVLFYPVRDIYILDGADDPRDYKWIVLPKKIAKTNSRISELQLPTVCAYDFPDEISFA